MNMKMYSWNRSRRKELLAWIRAKNVFTRATDFKTLNAELQALNGQNNVHTKVTASSDDSCEESDYVDAYPKVTESMETYARAHRQCSERLEKKLRLRGEFEQQLRLQFSECNLFIYGSSTSGFGCEACDMDLCLTRSDNIYVNDVKFLRGVRNILCQHNPLDGVQLIPSAKVPILRFIHRPTQIPCDLSIDNSEGVRNTHLLNSFTRCDPRFVPLVLTLKRWARHHKINDASRGTLSSYTLTLMALHFLQAGANPPVLPNLLAENPYVFHPSRALTALSFDDVLSGELVSRNVSTLGELFVGFLAYFSQEFDFKSQSISVREARAVAKTTPIEFSKQIYIEEPYNLKNVARAVKKESEPYIKKVIEESYAAICRSKELEPVLTLNVTKATKATMVKESAADSRISGGSPTEVPAKTDVSELYELADQKGFTIVFDVVGESGPSHSKIFVTRCTVILKKDGGELPVAATGQAATKKLSKQAAAKEMLLLLARTTFDVMWTTNVKE